MLTIKSNSIKNFKEKEIGFYITEPKISIKDFSYQSFMASKNLNYRIGDFLKSLGFNPEKMSLYNRLCFLIQFIPYVNSNYFLLLLGSKGTFKSTPYSCYSDEAYIESGIGTEANWRGHNNDNNLVPLLTKKIVVREEVAKDINDGVIGLLKNTAQSRKYKKYLKEESDTKTSVVLTRNIYSALDNLNQLGNKEIIFYEMSENFKDDAFLDRFNCTIFRDKRFKVTEDMFFHGEALNITLLMQSMGILYEQDYPITLSNALFEEPREHSRAYATVQGLCKILYPEGAPPENIIDGLTIFALHLFLVGKRYSPPFTSQSIPLLIEACGFNDVEEVTLYENRAIFKIKDEDYAYKVGLTEFGVEENLAELEYFKSLVERNDYIADINIGDSDKFIIRHQYFPVYSLTHSYNSYGDLIRKESTNFKDNILFNLMLLENIKNAVIYNQPRPQQELKAWKEMSERELKKIVTSIVGNCEILNKSDYYYDNKKNFKMINPYKFLQKNT